MLRCEAVSPPLLPFAQFLVSRRQVGLFDDVTLESPPLPLYWLRGEFSPSSLRWPSLVFTKHVTISLPRPSSLWTATATTSPPFFSFFYTWRNPFDLKSSGRLTPKRSRRVRFLPSPFPFFSLKSISVTSALFFSPQLASAAQSLS